MHPWHPFPYCETDYRQSLAALKKSWSRLHRGDTEPWPADKAAQEAWRAYHAGDFGLAYETGLAAGAAGIHAANKAAMIHASYLEGDSSAKLACLKEVASRCEAQQQADPNDVNAWYFHAYALGRYSQEISVAAALAQGLGGKIKASLDRTLALAPQHAEAHIALGAWHAEIIDKVGSMVGALTYGAKKDEAISHFRQALALMPESAIARTEYADALVMLYGKSRLQDAQALYQEAAACEALDAMERLDVEAARTELA